jgi:hypothetical protein
MLGRFLELALVVDDPGAAWQRYQQQGFVPAETGDLWKHAYGVVACRGLALGLHASGAEDFSIVFVRPDVAALHRELTARGVKIEEARLGSDVFNELSLREPGGCRLRVLEARSFSPPAELPDSTHYGTFRSLSLPCRDLAKTAQFWQQLGLNTERIDNPWEGFTLPGTPLAVHARRALAEPALVFEQAGTVGPGAATPQHEPGERPHTLLRTDEDLAVVVLG